MPRHLYTPAEGGRPICPLELRAGIVEGAWTPSAAEIMAHSAAVMTPYEAESLLPKFGGFSPSRSSLDRLPKALSKRWEENRVAWEAAIRESEAVPVGTAIVAVSLDGVTVPMKGSILFWSDCRMLLEPLTGFSGNQEAGQVTRLPIRPIQEVFGLRRPEMPSPARSRFLREAAASGAGWDTRQSRDR